MTSGSIYQGVPGRWPFLMVLTSDHLTGATGKTVTVTVRKNGSTALAAVQGTIAEIGNGWYDFRYTSSDVNVAGPIAIHCTASACDDTDESSVVLQPVEVDVFGFDGIVR